MPRPVGHPSRVFSLLERLLINHFPILAAKITVCF
jgi:hypothetical protein